MAGHENKAVYCNKAVRVLAGLCRWPRHATSCCRLAPKQRRLCPVRAPLFNPNDPKYTLHSCCAGSLRAANMLALQVPKPYKLRVWRSAACPHPLPLDAPTHLPDYTLVDPTNRLLYDVTYALQLY